MLVPSLQTLGIYACYCHLPAIHCPPSERGFGGISVGLLFIDWALLIAPRVRLVQRQNLCPPVWVAVPGPFRNSGIEVLSRVELEILPDE